MPDGAFETRFAMRPDCAVPHLDVRSDMDNFVWAVSQMPAGESYMAAGSYCGFAEYSRLWAEVTGRKARYRQIGLEELVELASDDKEFGAELGAMYVYADEVGYDGGDGSLLWAQDIEKVSRWSLNFLDWCCGY